MNIDEIVAKVVTQIQQTEINQVSVPVGISNRHVHLSQEDLETLFGINKSFTKFKDLSQPGQYACKETVTLVGPKGVIENVRVLGPVRKNTQVEVLQGDCRKLGIQAEIRLSGILENTPGIILCGSSGSISLTSGVIVAKRHIHMTNEDAQFFGKKDGDSVSVLWDGERGGILKNVVLRVSAKSKLELHIDFDEANALGIKDGDTVKFI